MWVDFNLPRLAVVLNLTLHLDFSRKDYTGPPIKKLIDVINYVQPTALLGLSTVKVCQDVTKLGGGGLAHFRVGCVQRNRGQTHVRTEPATNHFPVVQPYPAVGGRIQGCS